MTPTPWRYDEAPSFEYYEGPLDKIVGADGKTVCDFGDSTQYYPTAGTPPDRDDAREMVRRVNAHDALVAALETLLADIERQFEENGGANCSGPEMARDALKAARG